MARFIVRLTGPAQGSMCLKVGSTLTKGELTKRHADGWFSPRNPFMPELAQRTPTTIREFMSKSEEFINAEETIRAFTELAEWAKMANKLKDHPQAEGSRGRKPPPKSRGSLQAVSVDLACGVHINQRSGHGSVDTNSWQSVIQTDETNEVRS